MGTLYKLEHLLSDLQYFYSILLWYQLRLPNHFLCLPLPCTNSLQQYSTSKYWYTIMWFCLSIVPLLFFYWYMYGRGIFWQLNQSSLYSSFGIPIPPNVTFAPGKCSDGNKCVPACGFWANSSCCALYNLGDPCS